VRRSSEEAMVEQTTRVAELFDRLADDYDNVGVEFFGPIAAGLVAALAPRPGDRALDVGCGRGAALVPLAEAVGPDGSVMGIDISPRMVALARDAVASAGTGGPIEVRVGDASAPDLPERSVDVVASSLVLFFLPDPLVALRAWRELLVDGGRIGVATFGPYSDEWRECVDAELARHAAPGSHDARTTGARGPFASDAAMEALLAEAGFRDVGTQVVTVSPRFDDPEHWRRFSMSVGQRQFWESIPAAELGPVRDAVCAAVDRCRDEHGRIGFDQQVRYTLGTR
jgi:ubiquinone/menaquinone biosynthesis C-methylase UbiE